MIATTVRIVEIPRPRRIERRPSERRRRINPASVQRWVSHDKIFGVRCEILALLVRAGECDFHDAVDCLRDEADANRIDADTAQAAMAAAFGSVPR